MNLFSKLLFGTNYIQLHQPCVHVYRYEYSFNINTSLYLVINVSLCACTVMLLVRIWMTAYWAVRDIFILSLWTSQCDAFSPQSPPCEGLIDHGFLQQQSVFYFVWCINSELNSLLQCSKIKDKCITNRKSLNAFFFITVHQQWT